MMKYITYVTPVLWLICVGMGIATKDYKGALLSFVIAMYAAKDALAAYEHS